MKTAYESSIEAMGAFTPVDSDRFEAYEGAGEAIKDVEEVSYEYIRSVIEAAIEADRDLHRRRNPIIGYFRQHMAGVTDYEPHLAFEAHYWRVLLSEPDMGTRASFGFDYPYSYSQLTQARRILARIERVYA